MFFSFLRVILYLFEVQVFVSSKSIRRKMMFFDCLNYSLKKFSLFTRVVYMFLKYFEWETANFWQLFKFFKF